MMMDTKNTNVTIDDDKNRSLSVKGNTQSLSKQVTAYLRRVFASIRNFSGAQECNGDLQPAIEGVIPNANSSCCVPESEYSAYFCVAQCPIHIADLVCVGVALALLLLLLKQMGAEVQRRCRRRRTRSRCR